VRDEDGVARDGSGEALDDPHQAAFVAQVYDGEHAGDIADVAWVVRLAGVAGGPVADLGCGTGRLTLPLAAAGFDVVAVDRSPAMLARLRAKLPRQSAVVRQRVHIEQAEVVAWNAHPRDLALALVGYNTFAALLTADDQQRCLTAIKAALRAGGTLAIATAAVGARVVALPEGFSREVYRRSAPELGKGVELVRRDIHRWTDETRQVRQLALVYDVLQPDGGRQRYQYEYAARYTSRWELEHLLARCGFDDVRVWGGYQEEAFAVEGGLLVVTAA